MEVWQQSDMIEKTCNLWIEPADFRCILTHGATNDDGEAILDFGVAKEAVDRFSGLATDLGRLLTSRGNHAHLVRPGLVSFPVKQYQWGLLDLAIIARSGRQLVELVGEGKALLPRPEIGPTDPPWEKIAEALSFLPDNIIVIEHT
jgi:hypothetical protein